MDNKEQLKHAILNFPDAKLENEVVRYFRTMGEAEIMEYIVPIIEFTRDQKRISLIKVLSRVLRDKQYLLLLLKIGIEKSLVSEIKGWLTALAPRLGIKKMASVIYSIENEEMKSIAVYQLRSLVAIKYPKDRYILDEIESSKNQRG